jgi:hypothetical protein
VTLHFFPSYWASAVPWKKENEPKNRTPPVLLFPESGRKRCPWLAFGCFFLGNWVNWEIG